MTINPYKDGWWLWKSSFWLLFESLAYKIAKALIGSQTTKEDLPFSQQNSEGE